MDDNLSGKYLLNSILYYCLLFVSTDSIDADSLTTELAYIIKRC